MFVFLAGHETTTNGIASGLMALLQHPDQFSKLKANVDAHVRGTVEEALRFESPVTRAVRKATERIELAGKVIESGQLVVFLLGAADRDPALFPVPDTSPAHRTNTSPLVMAPISALVPCWRGWKWRSPSAPSSVVCPIFALSLISWTGNRRWGSGHW